MSCSRHGISKDRINNFLKRKERKTWSEVKERIATSCFYFTPEQSHPTSIQPMGHPSGMFRFSLSTFKSMPAKTFPRINRSENPTKRGECRLFPKKQGGL